MSFVDSVLFWLAKEVAGFLFVAILIGGAVALIAFLGRKR